MAYGKLGRKAKAASTYVYKANKILGVPTWKAKKRANKAGRKVVAKATGFKRKFTRRFSRRY